MHANPQPRRFTLLVNELHMGGAEKQALILCREWLNMGLEVELAALEQEGVVRELAREWGIPCRVSPRRLKLSHLQKPIAVARMRRFLADLNPEVLLSYTAKPNVLSGLSRQVVPLWIWNQRDQGLYRQPPTWEQTAAAAADGFLANSQASARHLREDLSVSETRIRVIPNAIDLPAAVDRVRIRQAMGIGPEDPVAIMVGNLRPPKDHPTLLRAWRKVCSAWEGSAKPRLWLAGRVDSRSPDFQPDPDLAGSVTLLGHRPDVADLLGAADVCVFASTSEGLPNAVLEGMAAGLPVVASDLPAIRECLGDHPEPALVPQGDDETFAARILELLRDPGARDQIGRENRERIRTQYAPGACAVHTLETIQEWWEKRKRGAP